MVAGDTQTKEGKGVDATWMEREGAWMQQTDWGWREGRERGFPSEVKYTRKMQAEANQGQDRGN